MMYLRGRRHGGAPSIGFCCARGGRKEERRVPVARSNADPSADDDRAIGEPASPNILDMWATKF